MNQVPNIPCGGHFQEIAKTRRAESRRQCRYTSFTFAFKTAVSGLLVKEITQISYCCVMTHEDRLLDKRMNVQKNAGDVLLSTIQSFFGSFNMS